MERIRWSEKAASFRSLVNNPAIPKPALVQIGNKAIVVGEKINGEFIMASPCKVSGDRFDIMPQEIVLSSKHTGVWRVISKATSKKEGHIHRLTTKDLERIHKQDISNERSTPRSYICIRDIEGFELIMRNNDGSVANSYRVDRRKKQIEENVEFEITDTSEVEYTPSEGERTSQDYVMVPKIKQKTFLQLLLPGVVEQEQVIRNRVVRALHCVTKNDVHKRHFLLEVNEQPCEIRPVASEGSTELRYLHSTQNLYDYMLSFGKDTVLYVKLLRGDPPIKAIEFDGYMVLKHTLNGDKIPICRVEDLEITLVDADLPVKVRLPTRGEHVWRSLPEFRAAEIQCMQLSLALFARHESEMYVTIEDQKNSRNYSSSTHNQESQSKNSRHQSDAVRKHFEECEKVFGQTQHHENNTPKTRMTMHNDSHSHQSTEAQLKNLMLSNGHSRRHHSTNNDEFPSPLQSSNGSSRSNAHSHQSAIKKTRRSLARQTELDHNVDQGDSYNRFQRTTIT